MQPQDIIVTYLEVRLALGSNHHDSSYNLQANLSPACMVQSLFLCDHLEYTICASRGGAEMPPPTDFSQSSQEHWGKWLFTTVTGIFPGKPLGWHVVLHSSNWPCAKNATLLALKPLG